MANALDSLNVNVGESPLSARGNVRSTVTESAHSTRRNTSDARDAKKGVVVVRVTKSRCFPFDDDHPVVNDDVNDDDDFDERGFGTTGGIGHMHHL